MYIRFQVSPPAGSKRGFLSSEKMEFRQQNSAARSASDGRCRWERGFFLLCFIDPRALTSVAMFLYQKNKAEMSNRGHDGLKSASKPEYSWGELLGGDNDSSNVGQCLTSQDSKLQCGTNSLHRSTKWKVFFHFLCHLIQVHQQRAHHEQIKKPIHDMQATVSMFIVGQNHPMPDLRSLLWLLGCAPCYLPFCSVVAIFLLSKVLNKKKKQHKKQTKKPTQPPQAPPCCPTLPRL